MICLSVESYFVVFCSLVVSICIFQKEFSCKEYSESNGNNPNPLSQSSCRSSVLDDSHWLSLLVDLRTWCSSKNAVRGNISALIVRGNTLLSWGHVRSLIVDIPKGKKGRANADLHAEADAVTCAARNGISLDGSTLYCSSICCIRCFRLVVASGVIRVVHPPPPTPEFYGKDRKFVNSIAKIHGVDIDDRAILPGFRKLENGKPSHLLDLKRCWGQNRKFISKLETNILPQIQKTNLV